MPASPLQSAATPAEASFERWLLLGFCALISLGMHLWLVLGWHVAPGQGDGRSEVRARLRAHPARVPMKRLTDLPTPKPAPEKPALPSQPALAQSAQAEPEVPPATQPPEAPVPAGGWPLPDYVPAELLSIRPGFLVELDDSVFAALDDSEAGKVVLSLLVSASGEIDEVQVDSSELSAAGTEAFVASLQRLQLSPGMLDGEAVAARWRLEFNFMSVPALPSGMGQGRQLR